MRSIRCQSPNHVLKDLCFSNQLNQALQFAQTLVRKGETIHVHDFYCLLQSCIRKKNLLAGREVHSLIKEYSLDSNSFLGSHLIRLYETCGRLSEADSVFDRVLEPDVFAWNNIISAHSKLGKAETVLELFWRMHQSRVQPDKYVFVALLKACSYSLFLNQGVLIHSYLIEAGIEEDIFICSILIDMYSNGGSLPDARENMNRIQNKDVVVWNAMLMGCAEHGEGEEVLMLFKQMQLEGIGVNDPSLLSVLRACCAASSLQEGIRIHASIVQSKLASGPSIENALIDMYAKSGDLEAARVVFEQHSHRDVVTWNTIIAGYLQAGHVEDALVLSDRMKREGFKANITTKNTVIAGLVKHGLLKEALQVCLSMEQEGLIGDIVTWNSLLSGLLYHGHNKEALILFSFVLKTNLKPTVPSFVAILKTCSEPTSLCDGQRFHSHIIESKLESDLTIVSALLDMYSNCRCIEHAFTVFNRIKAHNVFTWSTLIAGLVHNNYCKRALKVFASMQRAGCKPNNVTFVSVLSACCHAGLVDEGYSYFMLMYECQGMLPTLEHFNCLVELFSSCGYLWEAEHILLSIPFQHNIVGWTSLLRNCGKHKEILIARNSLDRALAIDCRHAALYITMSNIYNEIGMTEDAQEMLSAKKLLELQKL